MSGAGVAVHTHTGLTHRTTVVMSLVRRGRRGRRLRMAAGHTDGIAHLRAERHDHQQKRQRHREYTDAHDVTVYLSSDRLLSTPDRANTARLLFACRAHDLHRAQRQFAL